MKQELVDAIHALAIELEKNHKQDTAAFYRDTESRVVSECHGNRAELIELLGQLERSGAIVQYADFNAREESLWNVLHDAAARWRRLLS